LVASGDDFGGNQMAIGFVPFPGLVLQASSSTYKVTSTRSIV
jgi:hypothetical protein